MKNDPAIRVSNVSKSYRLYERPFDRAKEALHPFKKKYHTPFHALHDVSFSVGKGEILGIIGENGSGKSTLLQIIAGIAQPSSGNVEVNGRLTGLFEISAGFDPEFTGRQNVYMKSAVIGLSKKEIDERFNDIASFADIGEFMDQPVKTYSSGMQARLGFAVTTSVDPDILILDEVFSVGDQHFQQKAVKRMMELIEGDTTVLFCTHGLYRINEICGLTVWIDKGKIRELGKSSEVTSRYIAFMEEKEKKALEKKPPDTPMEKQTPEVIVEKVIVTDKHGNPLETVNHKDTIVIEIHTRRQGEPIEGHLGVGVRKENETGWFFLHSAKHAGHSPFVFSGSQAVKVVMPSFPIMSGSYKAIGFSADSQATIVFDQAESKKFVVHSERPELGVVWIEHEWKLTDSAQT
ncbi:ABC transporter ATP-binding protein [Candidatus Desulfarcum epimagneticum]|uniref:ABC transporter ATP-binding protein n=1 Tax=uncultured Desulfobacteraceae bacterium TaxID=218296 RepID=A0A484HJI9_9BACT|nr:ABC transporter ATP-binding protein [uncultured Desulfobacteraceae bacterium]